MNLRENISRIQEMMGVITENKAINLVKDMGLYDSIRYFGGYRKIMDLIGDYEFSNEEKIDFIRDAIKHLSEKYNTSGISIDELNMSPVTYGTLDPMGLEFQQIEYFSPDYVTIYMYGTNSYKGNFKDSYEDLDDNTLDNIFIFMIDAVEHQKK
jgi:hypothetical protein